MNDAAHPTDETLQSLAAATHVGLLSPEVRRHLDACPACAERWALVQEVWSALNTHSSPRDPEALWTGIETAIRNERSPRPAMRRIESPPRGSNRRWAWAAVAVISLGIGGMWWTGSSGGPGPSRLGSTVGSVRPAGLEALSAPQTSARVAAVGALEPLVDRPAVRDALVALLRSDPDEHVRLFALDVLRPGFEAGALPLELLLGTLAGERSPLVQTDLIVLIRSVSGPDGTDLRSRIEEASLHPFVAAQVVAF